jgi:hypothetical protein
MLLMVRSTFSGKENEKKTKSNYSLKWNLLTHRLAYWPALCKKKIDPTKKI